MAYDKRKWMFLVISGQNTLCSTQAVEKEQEPPSLLQESNGKDKDNSRTAELSTRQSLRYLPLSCQGWCWGLPGRCRGHTHCPASAAATLITFGEKHNHSTVIPPHFRVCSAHCFLLSLLLIVTGNLFKSLASIFISKRTQLLPRHYFYFFYCLNYSLNC